ncbi:MAG: hypothetical protein ACE5FG_10330 [Myxococcota bacterium]
MASLWLGLLLLPLPVRALEPLTVRAEGRVELAPEEVAQGRERALAAALTEAVLEVARGLLSPERMSVEQERLRESLEPRAAGFVLTYRVEASQGPRPAAEDPELRIFVVRLTATVDASAVRQALESLGLLGGAQSGPSVVIRAVQRPRAGAEPRAALRALERYVARRLEDAGMIVVEPALHPGGPSGPRSLQTLARQLGADIGVEITVRWEPTSSAGPLAAGRAVLRARAVRAADGFEIGLSSFEGPAYHEDPEEAFALGIEAAREQLAGNLVRQLERNWRTLAREEGPIRLRLLQVSSLREVTAVQRVLEERLGAVRADLTELSARTAELEVSGSLSPGGLQDRLAATAFAGFRLRPVTVSGQSVELRVARDTSEEALPGRQTRQETGPARAPTPEN